MSRAGTVSDQPSEVESKIRRELQQEETNIALLQKLRGAYDTII